MKKKPFARGLFVRGRFAKVYDAKWLNAKVAIKVVKATKDIEEQTQKTKSEADLAIGLQHPNVIRIFGTTWVKEKYPGIVMEKAEHGSLNEWIGKIHLEKARKIALGVVDGLDYLHSRKVVHRDIKPANILMCGPKDDMIPKISDFNVAKVLEKEAGMTGSIVGTKLYMAPEVRKGNDYSFTADIYSLAMTLFEIFNGQPLAQATEEVMQFVRAVNRGEKVKYPSLCPVPETIRGIIERGWDQEPENRPELSEYKRSIEWINTEKTEIAFDEVDMDRESFATGGFGRVYNANWRKIKVVLKVIKGDTHEEKQKAKGEADLTIGLFHPNIIQVFGTTLVKDKHPGIVMEKAEHGSLEDWIGKLEDEAALKIALGIVSGLQYVHSMNVIHRDIAPGNILMCGPKDCMIPKITDFGISKVIDTKKMHTAGVGKFWYMAHEVYMGDDYSFAADIYSLAVTLFEMFNGKQLTEVSGEVEEFLKGVRRGEVGKIPIICPVPGRLHNVIERGLDRAPANRPELSEYRSDLKAAIMEKTEIAFEEIEMDSKPFDRYMFAKLYFGKWRGMVVVIKVIKIPFHNDNSDYVKREYDIGTSLSHPNVARVFGATRLEDNLLGIVMEYAEHRTLDMWTGKLDHKKVREIALGIVDGLEYVHSMKVIHRNIRLKSILLCGPADNMIPKIADFVVSNVIEDTTTHVSGVTGFGHYVYIAPEVKNGYPNGFASDIYSLAMTLFEWFNGQRLAEAIQASKEVEQFVYAVCSGLMADIPSTCTVPASLHSIIERGLDPDPEQRPTLAEFRSALGHGPMTKQFSADSGQE